jgi:hypothetical protein
MQGRLLVDSGQDGPAGRRRAGSIFAPALQRSLHRLISVGCLDQQRSSDALAPGVVRKERMMLSRRLILMIALMVLHTEVDAALASPVRVSPDRHAPALAYGPASAPAACEGCE